MTIDDKVRWNKDSPNDEMKKDVFEILSVNKGRGTIRVQFEREYDSPKVLPISYVPGDYYERIKQGRKFLVIGNLRTQYRRSLVFSEFKPEE